MKLPSAITETYDYAIATILTRPNIGRRNIKPETALSIDVADAFRRHVKTGRYKGVFTHITNEGQRSPINGAILKAMGMVPGAADFIFAWGADAAFIELKQPTKKQNDNQRYFAMWCREAKVTYTVCHSVAEVESVITALGGIS